MRDFQTVLVDALALPEDQPMDEDAEDAWASTVARRVREIQGGTAVTVSVDDAFQSAWNRLADRQ